MKYICSHFIVSCCIFFLHIEQKKGPFQNFISLWGEGGIYLRVIATYKSHMADGVLNNFTSQDFGPYFERNKKKNPSERGRLA